MADDVKVTINPSAEAVAKALAEVVVTDANGRSIKLKKPGVLAQYRLVEALGDTAKNEMYRAMVMPLLYVAEINGEAVFPLTSKSQIEALIQQLDEAGIEAVSEGALANFGRSTPEADQAALKN